jgi:predicted PurR-regulated permease PerM
MLKRIGKNLLSLVLIFIMGALALIEVVVEVVYQTIRLIRRLYGHATDQFLEKIQPLYDGKVRRVKKIPDDDMVIYEFNYEDDEEKEEP